ncbi:MAG TPA: hypothetical protein ENH15_02205 [Actinobacteria bacterium]|nr:hypothetical protein [Actinomycetota bacterium]
MKEGSSGRRLINDGLANVASILGGAPEAGVAVLAGTDLHLAHGDVGVEVAGLNRYGLSVTDAQAAATESAFRYFGSPRKLAAGAPADLVCFPSNPLAGLAVLGRPSFIMRRGRVIHR